MKRKNINIISTNSGYYISIEILAKELGLLLEKDKTFNVNFFELKEYTNIKHKKTQRFLKKVADLFFLSIRLFLNPKKYKWINIFPYDLRTPTFLKYLSINKSVFIHHHFDLIPSWITKKILKNQDNFVCDTKFWKDELLSLFWKDKSKNIKIIPLPIQRESLKKKIIWNYILYVGSEIKRKNIPQLLAVFKEAKKYNTNLKLVKCWPESKENSKLLLLAKEKNIPIKDIIIYSNLNKKDLTKLYQNAFCFISCSKLEWFGMPIVEAMSVWCPVILSNIKPFVELVWSKWILCNEIQDFVEWINKLTKKDIYYYEYSNVLLNIFNKNFSNDLILKKRKEFLRNL